METPSYIDDDLDSPNWDKSTKMMVVAFTLIVLGLAVWQFQSLITILVIASIIAYILNVPIVWLEHYTPLHRGQSIGVIYLLFALIVVGILVAAGVTIYNQAESLVNNIQEIAQSGPQQFDDFMKRTIEVGPWSVSLSQFEIDFDQLVQQILSAAQGILGSGAQFAGTAATMTVSWLGNAVLIYVLSIYFAIELPHLTDTISDTIYQPGYRRDVKRLLYETGLVWHGYLRGQVTLAVIMVIIVTLTLTVLGVRNALALGLLAGILDFIPFLGPAIVVGLSTLVALFQDSNWLGLEPIWFALIVLVAGIILQQIEGNWLNPRIVGGALNLHPLLIMVGAIMGGTLAGILGVMLAAPVMATVKLFGTYAWRKMFDLKPFPDPPPPSEIDVLPE